LARRLHLTDSEKLTAIGQALLIKLATSKLKDSVQRQMLPWTPEELQKGTHHDAACIS
jgi:hypothetical protein